MYAVSTSVTFDLAKVTKCIGGEKTTTYFELAEIRGLGFANC
mgnify:CR=1 FL=1